MLVAYGGNVAQSKEAHSFCGIIRRGVYYKAVEIILYHSKHPYLPSI